MGIKFGEKEHMEASRGRHELKQFVIGTYTVRDFVNIVEFARQHNYYISEGVEQTLADMKLFSE